MRKVFCLCAGVTAAALLGLYTAGEYAYRHPGSWVDQGLHAAHKVGEHQMAVYRASAATAQKATRGRFGWVGPVAAPPHREEQCGQAPPVEMVHVEVANDLPPALLPGEIVVEGTLEEAEVAPPQPCIRDLIGTMPFTGAEECEGTLMPHVEEDLPVSMPRVEEDTPVFHPHDNICPRHSGCGVCPPRAIKGRELLWGNEECELLPPPTSHSSVDTMEFRPSDAPFGSDLRGPF